MTKKASIFKVLVEYFRFHPLAVAGWIWIGIVPILGSLVLASQYSFLGKINLNELWDHLFLTLGLSIILGLAFLPTTLTALACGFFWGWIAFPDLIIGYILANVIGYKLGKVLNTDFRNILYLRNPELEKEIESRLGHPAGLIFFIRISPVIPFAISNFLFASLDIPLKKVLVYGVPGMLPRTLLAFATGIVANSFLGAKESLNHPIQWSILVFLLALSAWGIYRSWKKAGRN
ncbi:VTT domain-containing protein [Algoriphagus sp. AK58]|uniref:VTT domain-containing protein n=1 Tax=Algoriphagus sp. AK58 TaxID=1406877 RepID=UPI0016500432|nr:VTT domain-containing protein [Algoriphagus sp. AK58]MBC6366912.1 hypothetical protein [Algoriphagus sp. AK58]